MTSPNAVEKRKAYQREWFQRRYATPKGKRDHLRKGHAYYRENREDMNTKACMRHRVKRSLVLAHYGGKCACCGEPNRKFLCIDHINGGGNKHREKIGWSAQHMIYWIIRNNYPKSFQVLCYNCNAAKSIYGLCPHLDEKKRVAGDERAV